MPRYAVFLVVLAFVLNTQFLTAQSAPSQASSGKRDSEYAGADTCKACHEELFNGVQRTPHSMAYLKSKSGVEVHSCESCHGPGAAHAEAGGDTSKIFSFKKASVREIDDRCLACHAKEHAHSSFPTSAHAAAELSCTSCHSPHHATERRALLQRAQPELCYGCHSEVRAEFSKEFRHRVNDGLIRCSDCHNVHAASTRSVRTSPEQDQVCFKCHRQLQGPFMFEHVPVKTEGCMSCHQPHGSVNPRMLTVNQVNLLCLQCHTPGTTPNTKTGDTNAPGTPSAPVHDQTMKFQACTMCHVSIHGSNADETFMK